MSVWNFENTSGLIRGNLVTDSKRQHNRKATWGKQWTPAPRTLKWGNPKGKDCLGDSVRPRLQTNKGQGMAAQGREPLGSLPRTTEPLRNALAKDNTSEERAGQTNVHQGTDRCHSSSICEGTAGVGAVATLPAATRCTVQSVQICSGPRALVWEALGGLEEGVPEGTPLRRTPRDS